MAITRRESLADNVTRALADFMGLPDFPTDSPFPELANSFAAVVDTSEVNKSFYGPAEVAANAQLFTQHLGEFITKLAELVE